MTPSSTTVDMKISAVRLSDGSGDDVVAAVTSDATKLSIFSVTRTQADPLQASSSFTYQQAYMECLAVSNPTAAKAYALLKVKHDASEPF